MIHHTTLSYKLVNLFDIPHNQKQRQTRHGRNIPNYCESNKPKGIKRENESATLYLTPPMTEVAESSSSNSDLEGSRVS